MPHTRLLRRVHHRLGLMRHGDGIAGENVHTVYAAERRAECARIVEIEHDRIVPLGAQSIQILLLSRTDPNARATGVADELFATHALSVWPASIASITPSRLG